MRSEKSNINRHPGERIEVGSSEQKNEEENNIFYLSLKSILKRRVARSCWKINNEKNKVVVDLWKTSRNYEVKFCH